MAKEVMQRNAADNEYLHKDFHGALSGGLIYLEDNFGQDSVREYLEKFATSYYAKLREQLQREGLTALKDHFEDLYATEGGEIEIEYSEDELILNVKACPAVVHMRANNYPVANMWIETDRTVNQAICAGSDFDYEMLEYDEQTGKSVQRFFRREVSGRSE